MAWNRPRRRQGRRCDYVDPDTAKECQAWAVRATYEGLEEEGTARCYLHQGTPEERSARARRAAAASATVRKGDVEAAPRLSGLDPGVTLAQLAPILREALVADHPWTHEPDWPTRLAAVGTLLASFPREYRRTPEDCSDLIRRAIPEELRSPELENAQRVYTELRASWDRVDGVRWSDLRGLWTAPYPAFMIAPWEIPAKIQGKRPKPTPPDSAPVLKLEDGRVALKRGGELPTLIPVAEPTESEWSEVADTEAVAW